MHKPSPSTIEPALVVMLAGVCAALHVGKLPPAIPVPQQAMGMSLVQSGFLLSMVQLAGMVAGVVVGVAVDAMGARRGMLVGLSVLALASLAGAWSHSVLALMWLRACEGFGFLLAALAAPALIRALVQPTRLNLMLGLWGAYMPLATAIALLTGPWVVAAQGWPAWWAGLGVLTAAMAGWLARAVPAASSPVPGPRPASSPLTSRLRRTLAAPGPWLLAAAFAAYSSQWLAVIGFLPTMQSQAGLALAQVGLLAALAAAANIIGNVVASRLLHRGVPAVRVLMTGYAAMGMGALLAFGQWPGSTAPLLPQLSAFLAVVMFSGFGGLVPATLFTLTVPATPPGGSLPVTVGWMQQGSAMGQFCGPPLVAAVAAWAGGWQLTWWVTASCSLLGLLLSVALARLSAVRA